MIKYPEGARLRVKEICSNPRTGRAGLLPISRVTWYRWVQAGKAPQGQLIGANTRVWKLEDVLRLGEGAQ